MALAPVVFFPASYPTVSAFAKSVVFNVWLSRFARLACRCLFPASGSTDANVREPAPRRLQRTISKNCGTPFSTVGSARAGTATRNPLALGKRSRLQSNEVNEPPGDRLGLVLEAPLSDTPSLRQSAQKGSLFHNSFFTLLTDTSQACSKWSDSNCGFAIWLFFQKLE
jgi:hypothetical protein